jgi:hypothetical protein
MFTREKIWAVAGGITGVATVIEDPRQHWGE